MDRNSSAELESWDDDKDETPVINHRQTWWRNRRPSLLLSLAAARTMLPYRPSRNLYATARVAVVPAPTKAKPCVTAGTTATFRYN